MAISRFILEKDTASAAQKVELCDLTVIMAFHETLDVAARNVTAWTLVWKTAHTGLGCVEAWRHASIFADLRTTQVVNGKEGVHCVLNRRTLIGADPA